MRSIFALPPTLLALTFTTLTLALPQQIQSSSAQAINPINGLPIPVSGTVAATGSASGSSSKATSSTDDEDSSSSLKSSPSTITSLATLSPKPTSISSSPDSDSSETTSSTSEESTTDTNLIVWTDTAEHTIYTMTRVPTFTGPDPSAGVPIPSSEAHPTRATVTAEITEADGQVELVPTKSVDTFVQAYSGAAERLDGAERVWWLVMGGGFVGGVWGVM